MLWAILQFKAPEGGRRDVTYELKSRPYICERLFWGTISYTTLCREGRERKGMIGRLLASLSRSALRTSIHPFIRSI